MAVFVFIAIFIMLITYGTVIVSFIRDHILDVVTGNRKKRINAFLKQPRDRELFSTMLTKRTWFKIRNSAYAEVHDRVLVSMLNDIAPTTNDKIFFLAELGYETSYYNEVDSTKEEVLVAVFPNKAVLVLE